MNIHRTNHNPIMGLSFLIRPEEDRLLAIRAAHYDSYVLVDGKKLITPRPPYIPSKKARQSLFDMLASSERRPGEAIKIVRLSESRIGVYCERGSRCENELLEEYGNYIASIECPSKYARAWRDFMSLILENVHVISSGLRSVLEGRGETDIDARIESAVDLAVVSSLAPYVDSLRKMFDLTSVFYANRLMRDRFESALVKGQKHHMGNALFLMVLLNHFLDGDTLTYADLQEIIDGADGVFNPLVHMREALSREDVGRWLEVSVKEGDQAKIRPSRGPALRRVVDEIFYRAGAEANGSAQKIDVRWHSAEGVLSLWTDGDAFRSFRKDSPARKRLSEVYGDGALQFIKEKADRAEDRISLIRIGVERKDGSRGGSGGGAAGTGSDSNIANETSAAALGMQAGAELYATSMSAATAASVSIPSR